MAWNNQGGPWGGGGKSPWGRGNGPSGGGGGGNRPPDFEEMLRRGQDRMKSVLPGGFGSWRGLGLVVVAVIALWGATGFYVVNPGEIGVNTIFGVYKSQTEPGLHWNPPAPIGKVYTPNVSYLNSTYIGFRGSADTSSIPEESLMLTKDENIIDIKAVAQWRIKAEQVRQYLFEIADPDASVKSAVESAIREIIGQSDFQNAITVQKGEIAASTQQLAQKMLDTYHAGIRIESINLNEVTAPQEVIDAFRDVQRASNDAQSAVNDAYAYRNKVVQAAQGQAVKMVKEAEAYKAEKIANAQGDSQRFLSIYEQYKHNPSVTERRLYLESMQSIFGGMNKVLIDPSAGGPGTVPYLPLDQLIKKAPGNTLSNQPQPPADSDTTVQPAAPQQGAAQ
jgi:membrane protease subunit HflK